MTEQRDWTRAYLLVGQDSAGDLVPVLSDAGGQIVVLFQGQRGGVNTTVAVDANGRIEFFGLDDEDQWGQVLRIGSGELAARLDSPRTYDWRGNTLFQTDFEHGIGGAITVALGAGSSVAVDANNWLTGGQGVALTGGSTTLWIAQIAYCLPISPSDRVGVESWFMIDGDTRYILMGCETGTGTTGYWGYLRLDVQNTKLQYMDSASAWQDIATLTFEKLKNYWHAMKLVINRTTGKYVRAMYRGTEYDLSAYDLYVQGAAFGQYLYINFQNESRDGQNDLVTLDRFIATSAEPA